MKYIFNMFFLVVCLLSLNLAIKINKKETFSVKVESKQYSPSCIRVTGDQVVTDILINNIPALIYSDQTTYDKNKITQYCTSLVPGNTITFFIENEDDFVPELIAEIDVVDDNNNRHLFVSKAGNEWECQGQASKLADDTTIKSGISADAKWITAQINNSASMRCKFTIPEFVDETNTSGESTTDTSTDTTSSDNVVNYPEVREEEFTFHTADGHSFRFRVQLDQLN